MFKRRRTYRLKSKLSGKSPSRRRIQMKNAHKKTLLRKRKFTQVQMEELRSLLEAEAKA